MGGGRPPSPKQAVAAAERIATRFADRRWVETVMEDYGATPADGVRRVRSVRHTAKAASILLLTRHDDELAAEILWTLVTAASDFVNGDGGCREEVLLQQPSSVYASAYMLQLLESVLAHPDAPRFLPEYDRWAEAAGGLVDGLRRYMAESWRSTRWAYGSAPWELNAPYIVVDVAPWLPSDLRKDVRATLREQLTPTGRLAVGGVGDAFATPEPISALRTAYALTCVSDRGEDDGRLAGLRAWLSKQDWGRARLRPCDVTFLAHIVGASSRIG